MRTHLRGSYLQFHILKKAAPDWMGQIQCYEGLEFARASERPDQRRNRSIVQIDVVFIEAAILELGDPLA